MKNSILLVFVVSAMICATSAYPQPSSDLQLLSEIQDILSGIQDDGEELEAQGSELEDIITMQESFNGLVNEQEYDEVEEDELAKVLAELQDDGDEMIAQDGYNEMIAQDDIDDVAEQQDDDDDANAEFFSKFFNKIRKLPKNVRDRFRNSFNKLRSNFARKIMECRKRRVLCLRSNLKMHPRIRQRVCAIRYPCRRFGG